MEKGTQAEEFILRIDVSAQTIVKNYRNQEVQVELIKRTEEMMIVEEDDDMKIEYPSPMK